MRFTEESKSIPICGNCFHYGYKVPPIASNDYWCYCYKWGKNFKRSGDKHPAYRTCKHFQLTDRNKETDLTEERKESTI